MANEPKPLHIVRLTAENFKRLTAVTITPKGRMVQIAGKNTNGKSSVLDAIWAVLGGGKQIPGQPIHRGAEKARIQLDMGEIIVTRTITPTGTTLKVEDPEGRSFKSPQTMLDGLMGNLAFDPYAFTRMAASAQADELRKVAGITLDIDLIDSQIKDAYERRTKLNKEAKTAEAAADSIRIEPVGEKTDLGALLDRLQAITEQDRLRSKAISDKEGLEKQIEEQKDRMLRAQQAIAQIKEWLEVAEPRLAELVVPEVDDATAIREAIQAGETQNQKVQAAEQMKTRKQEYAAQAARYEKESDALTDEIEAKQKAKDQALADAAMPVEGLGFKDGEITFNGLPFDQASAAEQLRVSMGIAMAANPRLRVIRITDGSLLDEDNLAMIEEMAREHDFQIWIEQVDSTGTVGIYIEDGAVLRDNQSGDCALDPADFDAVSVEVVTPGSRAAAVAEANRLAGFEE